MPPSPFRLPTHGGGDFVMTVRAGVASRLLLVERCPVLVRAWEPVRGRLTVRAEGLDPAAVELPPPALEQLRPAGPGQLAEAASRMRFALGVDDDLGEFYRRFRRDPCSARRSAAGPGCGRGAGPGPGRRSPGRWSSS